VVTGIDYVLREVGPEVVGGLVAWPASEAPKVLELYRTLAETPPELTLVTLMRVAPPAPWLPKQIHGKPIIAMLACHSGEVEAGEKAVAPIKAFGKPVGDVLVRRPYAQQQALLDATQPKGGATTGRASTCRASSPRCARSSRSTPIGSARRTPP